MSRVVGLERSSSLPHSPVVGDGQLIVDFEV